MELRDTVLRNDDLIKLSIPSVRYALSLILKREYDANQTDIAQSLGITQAAVNKYLNKKCSKEIVLLGGKITNLQAARRAATQIMKAKGKDEKSRLIDRLASSTGVLGLAARLATYRKT